MYRKQNLTCTPPSNPSVVIIGAGPAGIAAATKLLEHSVTNVTILEAENRVGGRINSVKFAEAFVDIGAEYVHGEKGNVVYQLAKNYDLFESNLGLLQNVYYSNGSKIDESFIEDIESLLTDLEKYSTVDDDYDLTGKSLGDLFIHRYNSTLLKKYENDKTKLKLLKEGITFAEGFVVSVEGSFSWFDSSACSDYTECEGDQSIIWKGCGFKTILEILTKSYPDSSNKLQIDDKIHLNKKVTNINWNHNQTLITVQTKDGSSYSADYVIITTSLGVLKEKYKTLFDPPLPSLKIEAIKTIGFAGVIKIFLHFPIKWWKHDDKCFSFFWAKEDLCAIDFNEGPSKDNLSWIVQLRELIEAPHNSNVLVGWIGGDLVPEIEQISLQTLKNGCNYVIKKFLGKRYNITEIGEIIHSTWCSNENFRGTYSYTKTGTYDENLSYFKILSEPLKNNAGLPKVLFAGEATSPSHYSTVHGAIETGFREANRILKLHNKLL